MPNGGDDDSLGPLRKEVSFSARRRVPDDNRVDAWEGDGSRPAGLVTATPTRRHFQTASWAAHSRFLLDLFLVCFFFFFFFSCCCSGPRCLFSSCRHWPSTVEVVESTW